MPLPIYRLRRWLATIAAVFTVVVAGMYFSARQRQHNFLKEVPGKIGYDVKQTAKGFQFSKSDGGRTLFTIEADNLKQFKLNGLAELHNVKIVLYGRDSTRFDRIYGDNFTYDPKTGDVSAKGDVQIDLEANPAGHTGPDQAAPPELTSAVHLKTRDLVFNKETGNASTDARTEFRSPQASGWAVGVQYAGHTNTLTLSSQVHVLQTGPNASMIQAAHAEIINEPRQIVLEQASLERGDDSLQADAATLLLGADNNVEHVYARGNVQAQAKEEPKPVLPLNASTLTFSADTKAAAQTSIVRAYAHEGELSLGGQNRLQRATLAGDVHFEKTGSQPMQGYAGRVGFDFTAQNRLKTVHADEGVRLLQQASGEMKSDQASVQNFEMTAPTVDFMVAGGRYLDRAITSGNGQITISSDEQTNPANRKSPQRTIVTAGKFDARFAQTPDGQSRLNTIHGAPQAKIVRSTGGEPDRISTSDMVDASFFPQGGVESITQQGHVAYTDGQTAGKETKAWADRARYTPADQVLVLTGKPRITQGNMSTTATTIRLDRASDDANADGEVKSSYNQIQARPDGALLASASPIHVTAESMTAHGKPAVALYSGNARLWQDANLIEAPSIQFDRECRCVTAQGTPKQPVLTTIVQEEKKHSDKDGEQKSRSDRSSGTNVSAKKDSVASSIFLSGNRLTYADADRKVHYEGRVSAKGVDFTASAKTMDLFLKPRSEEVAKAGNPGQQLDHIVAQDDVVIQQTGRRALGKTLIYQADEDKFTLNGGPPSIFDAERGKITGDSLTFFRRDDRVLVEGKSNDPVVTQTRVAR